MNIALITQINFALKPDAVLQCNIEYDGDLEAYKKQLISELQSKYNIQANVNLTYKLIDNGK